MVSRLFHDHPILDVPPHPRAEQVEDDVESECEQFLATLVKKKRICATEPGSGTKRKASSSRWDPNTSSAKASRTPAPEAHGTQDFQRPAQRPAPAAAPPHKAAKQSPMRRAKRGTAYTFNGKRPPKCPVRLAAHMLAYEKHQQQMRQLKEERKAAPTRGRRNRVLSQQQEAYRQHFTSQMKNREGDSRQRLKRAAAAWTTRHDDLRAAAE